MSLVFVAFQVGSDFTVQLLANILKLPLLAQCTGSKRALWNLGGSGIFFHVGVSVVGTNLLCQRHLLQKAKVMVKMSVFSSANKIALPLLPLPPF
jgi:hypothetical protein